MATGPHLILFYDYVPDIVERRPAHREPHLARIGEWRDEGRIVMAGALGDPPTGAAIVFAGADVADVEAFADGDPYVLNGLVTARRIVPWTVVASA
jgi:uncharacterized protein YciI